MPLTVKNIVLWRAEVQNEPGTLAASLKPLAEAGVDLQVMMAYRYPDEHGLAAIELYPVSGRKAINAAQSAGLTRSGIPTLLVEGDNKPALGHTVSSAVAEAGINIAFFVAQVIGRKFSAVIGFENEAEARKASGLIKKLAGQRRR